MRIKVTAQNAIPHSEYGLLEPDKEYDVKSLSGIRGHVQVLPYETKVVHDQPVRPIQDAGIQSSASPAGQASPEQTVTRRRRGRRSRTAGE